MKLKSFFNKEGTKSVLSTLISILIGLVVGAIVLLIVGIADKEIGVKGAWDGIRIIVMGLFTKGREAGRLVFGFNSTNIGDMLFRAVPIIMTGLSVSLAYKTGLFNIGASGQYLAGTTATLFLALSIPTTVVPAWLVWIIAFFGGILAGALWGAIPGMLKAFLNINEVLACIMTNWLAANLVTWIFDLSNLKCTEGNKDAFIWKTMHNGVQTSRMGLDKLFPGSQQVNGGIIVAILIAILVYILLTKTILGFELKACGSNRHAARYAGIKDKRNIVLSMAIAGALAGGGAALYWLSGTTEFRWETYQALPGEGFTGIAVALLGACNPIANIFSGMFLSTLDVSGTRLSYLTGYNEYMTDIIIAVIVYLSAFSLFIKMWLTKRFKKTEDRRIPDHVITSKTLAEEAKKAEKALPADRKSGKGGKK